MSTGVDVEGKGAGTGLVQGELGQEGYSTRQPFMQSHCSHNTVHADSTPPQASMHGPSRATSAACCCTTPSLDQCGLLLYHTNIGNRGFKQRHPAKTHLEHMWEQEQEA